MNLYPKSKAAESPSGPSPLLPAEYIVMAMDAAPSAIDAAVTNPRDGRRRVNGSHVSLVFADSDR